MPLHRHVPARLSTAHGIPPCFFIPCASAKKAGEVFPLPADIQLFLCSQLCADFLLQRLQHLVDVSPNSDGNYTVIYNSAPSAPPSITAPATCYSQQHQYFLRGGDRSGRRRADLLFRALIQQRRVDTGSSVRKQDVHGSGIDRVEHVKIPRPRKGQLRQLFRIHHKRRYCRNP